MDISNTSSKISEAWLLHLKHVCGSSRCLLICIVVCLSFPTISNAQRPLASTVQDRSEIVAPKRFYLKLNPIPILHGPIPNTSEYRIGFEVVGGERFSYQIAGSYLNKSILINALADDSIQNVAEDFEFPGFRFQLQARYYLMKIEDKTVRDRMIPTGIYIAIHTSYAAATWKSKDLNLPKADWSNLTINGMIGAQLMADDDFGLDMFFGLGYKQNKALFTDYRGRTSEIDIRSDFGGPLGNYLASPIKVSLGFHLTFGLL